ncbi:NAD(P)H-binding protein [Brenneria izbisi]|uniref:NAD(P)H-binding protein n=1 Tax=Brenneria izbisi TaxID=2939450 RepID=A0AA42C1R1_9GAMM|nr:NAD(P)H-binding protein [Brenneria izbisi]MCV9879667.1 NAD(P)H-binding protein [Brenneria izbisi]MCV9883139.1 NAD(P)H-binding protein [Brenneria izbisi]
MSRVLLLGATGLVGRELLQLLKENHRVETIYAPTRKPLPPAEKLVNPHNADLSVALSQLTSPIDIAFCCLGSTIKTAGSKQAFRDVDYTLVVDSAKAALALGAKHLLVVSALSANTSSPFFYSRVKGETEKSLQQQGWQHLTLAQPALLLGEREVHRPFERFAAPLFRLFPAKWRAIEGKTVAQALMNQAFSPEPKARVTVLESDQLRTLGRQTSLQ